MSRVLTIRASGLNIEASVDADGSLTVGRGDDNDLTVAEITLGRHHFEIRGDGDTWRLTDVHSPSGTYVNEAIVRAATPLAAGDEIRAGQVVFVVDLPPQT